MADLRRRGIVTKARRQKTGKTVGGISFTRGPLAYLLRNRFYVGEVVFKGEILPGEQSAIIDRELFDAVQAKLDEQVRSHKAARMTSQALLAGRIFDDRGNRMGPTHARKNGIKYRYYISAALVQGRTEQAGNVDRVPANDIEAIILDALRKHLGPEAVSDDATLVRAHLARVEVRSDRLIIDMTDARSGDRKKKRRPEKIEVLWRKTPSTRRRELLVPDSMESQTARPIRSENRALLVTSIAKGRRWLNELITDSESNVEAMALREGCSIRKINMTISLAFLAPDLVKAAIEGRLPHGMGVARLSDLPPEWSRQHLMLGLTSA